MTKIDKTIQRIKEFGLYHAMKDLPHSQYTVEAFNIAISALEEKQDRENSQPLLTNVERNIMLCPHCGTDLMEEFVEPQEEKYCPFCGYSIDLDKLELIKEN